MSTALTWETFGPVAKVTLNRPKAMNALNGAMVAALDTALETVAADPALRVLLVSGTGPAFCAGADLKEALGEEQSSDGPDFLDRAAAMMARMRALPKPVIAALNGVTMAGGLELALCADIILASESATIGDAHANFGVFPGAGGAALLPRVVPLNTAMYLLMSGRSLPARRWHDLGLIAELHAPDALDAAALALADDLAAKSPAVLRRMKAVALASADGTAADALAHEHRMLREHLRSDDLKEGLAAFAEKRRPRFTGN